MVEKTNARKVKVLLAPHTRVRCPCWRPQLPDACIVTDTCMIAIHIQENIQGPYSKCQYCMNDMYVFTDTQYNMYNMEREGEPEWERLHVKRANTYWSLHPANWTNGYQNDGPCKKLNQLQNVPIWGIYGIYPKFYVASQRASHLPKKTCFTLVTRKSAWSEHYTTCATDSPLDAVLTSQTLSCRWRNERDSQKCRFAIQRSSSKNPHALNH